MEGQYEFPPIVGGFYNRNSVILKGKFSLK